MRKLWTHCGCTFKLMSWNKKSMLCLCGEAAAVAGATNLDLLTQSVERDVLENGPLSWFAGVHKKGKQVC